MREIVSDQQENDMKITVYSTPVCMQCKITYREFKKHGIEYDIVDISENDAAREHVVDDIDHWSGFRPAHIERIAALQAA